MKGNIELILKMKFALSGEQKSSAHHLSFQLGHLDTYHTFFTFFYYVMHQKRHIHAFRHGIQLHFKPNKRIKINNF